MYLLRSEVKWSRHACYEVGRSRGTVTSNATLARETAQDAACLKKEVSALAINIPSGRNPVEDGLFSHPISIQ